MVDTTAKELLVPGAVLLLRTPQGEFKVTYGTTQLGTTSPPRADTHFRIASNTKSMTAAVIVQLAQEGKLSLDDPVSKYVPGVPNGDNITIDELLKMRSGLYNYTDAPELAATVDRAPAKVWTTEELLALAFARPPNFPPGTAYEYNNTNYTLLGLIAEKVDGKPMARAMQDRLFGPLGMHDTLLPPRTSNTIPDPCSHGYLYGSSSFVLTDTPYPPDIEAAARAGTLLPTDYTNLNPSFAYFPGDVIPPPAISPSGSRHWSRGASLTPHISAAGSTACRPRTRTCPTASSTGTAWSDCAGGRTRYIFTVAKLPATIHTWVTTPTAG